MHVLVVDLGGRGAPFPPHTSQSVQVGTSCWWPSAHTSGASSIHVITPRRFTGINRTIPRPYGFKEPAMWTANFWKQALERAIKTFAQAVLALLTGNGLGIVDVNWGNALSVGGLAALASVLTSIVTSGIGEKNDPSVVESS